VLDLISGVYVHLGSRSGDDPLGKLFTGLAGLAGVVRKVARLRPGTQDHQLGEVDSLAIQASAQLVQRFLHERGLCDRMTRMSGWHNLSVAPCSTDRCSGRAVPALPVQHDLVL